MSSNPEQAQAYQKLVLEYEALDQQIDALMERNGGHSENMSAQDRQTYRDLARQRDTLYNQIKEIEASWLDEEGNA